MDGPVVVVAAAAAVVVVVPAAFSRQRLTYFWLTVRDTNFSRDSITDRAAAAAWQWTRMQIESAAAATYACQSDITAQFTSLQF